MIAWYFPSVAVVKEPMTKAGPFKTGAAGVGTVVLCSYIAVGDMVVMWKIGRTGY